jgi:hypothetical protein
MSFSKVNLIVCPAYLLRRYSEQQVNEISDKISLQPRGDAQLEVVAVNFELSMPDSLLKEQNTWSLEVFSPVAS